MPTCKTGLLRSGTRGSAFLRIFQPAPKIRTYVFVTKSSDSLGIDFHQNLCSISYLSALNYFMLRLHLIGCRRRAKTWLKDCIFTNLRNNEIQRMSS